MTASDIILCLDQNQSVFESLLSGVDKETYLWKPSPKKWSLLEIVCHLIDEEREDFRTRVRHTLESPDRPLSSIDPVGWVVDREYMKQDFDDMVVRFINERKSSVAWLKSLKSPNWQNTFYNPDLGQMSAVKFLCNWLAHDYLHIRQINRVKYEYLNSMTSEDLGYAGNW